MIIAALPARLLNRVCGDGATAYHLNVLMTSVVLTLVLGFMGGSHLPGFCLFRAVVHLDCPFCGVTRAVGSTLHGDLTSAWSLNPVGVLVAVVLLSQIPWRLMLLTKRLQINPRIAGRAESLVNGSIVVLCLCRFALHSLLPG